MGKRIVVKVANEGHKKKILECLHNAELNGELDFTFSVLTEDVRVDERYDVYGKYKSGERRNK